MTKEEAIEKAKKLIALSQSDNPNESVAAIAAAQKMLAKFEIEMAELQGPDSGPSVDVSEIWTNTKRGSLRLDRWKLPILAAVAEANGCVTFTSRSWACFVGEKADAKKCVTLFDAIAAEVDRIARSSCRGLGVAGHNAFRMGMARTISSEIKRATAKLKEEMRGVVSERALVVVETKESRAMDFVRARHPGMRRHGYAGTISDLDAYHRGVVAGRGVYQRTSTAKLRG